MSAKTPVTAAVRQLRAENVRFEGHLFDYRRYPGAIGAAEALGLDPHLTVKTIVFATSEGDGVIALMNGDLEVSTKTLARRLRVKSVAPATQKDARRWTGYEFGGTSPFGTREKLPVFAHDEIATMPEVYINGGSRGFLVKVSVRDLLRVVDPQLEDLSA